MNDLRKSQHNNLPKPLKIQPHLAFGEQHSVVVPSQIRGLIGLLCLGEPKVVKLMTLLRLLTTSTAYMNLLLSVPVSFLMGFMQSNRSCLVSRMSSDPDAFAFGLTPQDNGEGLFSTPTSTFLGLDMPGAAFDLELEALNSSLQHDSTSGPRKGGLEDGGMDLHFDMEFPLHGLAEISDATYDAECGLQTQDFLELGALSSGLAPNSKVCVLKDNTHNAAPVDSDVLATKKASTANPNLSILQSSVPGDPSRSLESITKDRQLQFGGLDDEGMFHPIQNLGALDQDGVFHPVQSSSALLSDGTTQDLGNCGKRSTVESAVPFSTAIEFPIAQLGMNKLSPPYGDMGRVKRRKTSSLDSVTDQKHTVTDELPWQRGARLPSEDSQSTFHVWSLSSQSARKRSRKPYEKQRLDEVNAVRRMKACLKCREKKVAVSAPIE